ncbi:alanine racemase [Bacillus sp. REN16]|uniref:alanine racemase n=1 Tax=Bacillus sp. REN16 TaxID=2887296 RepID=UPI001E33B75C|nr:alanine racemase [Bacillus sp. REN16]MCC3358071.1 alanine racemase [Bacillus sp. REN16]
MDSTHFYRDTWVEVDLDCIFENVKNMKSFLPEQVDIMAVVKANAYGHGDAEVAKTALEAGATYLAVAFIDEGISLRHGGIDAPILVLGASRPTDVMIAAEHDLSLTIYSQEWLEEVIKNYHGSAPLSLHLKLDTGMGRLGVREKDEIQAVLQTIEQHPQVKLEGVFTHFATADETDTSYFVQQYQKFTQMLEWIPNKPKMIHCGNSATGYRFPEKVFNVVRLGIGMYGMTPSLEIEDQLPYGLQQAFSFHSKLVHVKQIAKGEKVSYGATFTADEDMWVGTVPVGYADGWVRKLQNTHVLVEGELCQIIGRICMDQFMVRLPKKIPVGNKVTLIGRQNDKFISVDDVAKTLETINYEITCTISFRVPRIFLRNKRIIEVRNPLLRH